MQTSYPSTKASAEPAEGVIQNSTREVVSVVISVKMRLGLDGITGAAVGETVGVAVGAAEGQFTVTS
jgi:tRNA-dihydrouridine synthase